jgi:hypothetical protein
MDEKVSRSPLTKKFPETLVMPISETLPNACNVVDIIAKIPADFCNFTPPIFAITPPSSSDFCKFAEKVKALLLSDPDEADFSDDPLVRKIEEAFEGWTLEERRRWAEEWREKHRRSK